MAVTLTIRHKAPPREHLLFSDHLTAADYDNPIRETYLGQAHIAGTGPEGTTCRECKYWGRRAFRKLPDGTYEEYIKLPGYYGKKHKTLAGEPKKAHCTRPILNKAKRLVPHLAKSCRLFDRSDSPLPLRMPE